jgi:hypothetical protein
MKGESERTFKANQDAMRLDERPWLGVSQLEINHSANGALEQQGSASNSGKTPARKVQAVMGVYTEENLYTPGDKDFTFIDYVVKKVWNNEIKAPDYLADAFSRRDPSYHGILPPQNTFRSQIFRAALKDSRRDTAWKHTIQTPASSSGERGHHYNLHLLRRN